MEDPDIHTNNEIESLEQEEPDQEFCYETDE